MRRRGWRERRTQRRRETIITCVDETTSATPLSLTNEQENCALTCQSWSALCWKVFKILVTLSLVSYGVPIQMQYHRNTKCKFLSSQNNTCPHATIFALRLKVCLEIFKQLCVAHVLNHFHGCRSKRVLNIVFLTNLVEKIVGVDGSRSASGIPENVAILNLLHNGMWQSGSSELMSNLFHHSAKRDTCHPEKRVNISCKRCAPIWGTTYVLPTLS